jgi:hypothetical protein
MTTKKFDDVFKVVELSSTIMDWLALPALLALSLTTQGNYHQVLDYMASKLATIVAPFGILYEDLIHHLRATESLLVGTIPLKAVAPACLPILTNTLEFVVPAKQLSCFKNWITIECDYVQDSQPCNHSPHPFGPVKYISSYSRTVHHHKMVVNVSVVNTIGNSYEVIFHSFHTAHMNAINGQGFFCAYPSLIADGKAVHNAITHTIALEETVTSARMRILRSAYISEATTRKDGFEFITPDRAQQCQDHCVCDYRSACPLTLRNTNDAWCMFLRTFTKAEVSAMQGRSQRFMVRNSRLPQIVWKLAEASSDSAGFAFELKEIDARTIVASHRQRW